MAAMATLGPGGRWSEWGPPLPADGRRTGWGPPAPDDGLDDADVGVDSRTGPVGLTGTDGWATRVIVTDRDALLVTVDGVIVELERCEQARQDEARRVAWAIDDAVIASILRTAMPPYQSPLGRLVSLCRFIDDFEAGRVDLREYDTRTVEPVETDTVLQHLEEALTNLEKTSVGFDADYFHVPAAPIYGGGVLAPEEHVGWNTRGATVSRSLEQHWQYGPLYLGATALPGQYLEDRSGPGEPPIWVEFAGPTPYAGGRGRPFPLMGEGRPGMLEHAYHWWVVEVGSWDPMPSPADNYVLRESILDAWEAVNHAPKSAAPQIRRSEFEWEVDQQYEHLWGLNDQVRLAQAHQRLALVSAVTQWADAVGVDSVSGVEGPRRNLRFAYAPTGEPELVWYIGTGPGGSAVLWDLYDRPSAVRFLDRCAEPPCRLATYTGLDVDHAVVRSVIQAMIQDVVRAVGARSVWTAERRWRERRDGPPPAGLGRRGHLLRVGEEPGGP